MQGSKNLLSVTSTPKTVEPVSKVTFFPVSDGKTDALIVTIKKVIPDVDENSKVMETPKPVGSSESKKRTRSSRTLSSTFTNKSTNTEESNKISLASQTSIDMPSTSTPEHAPAKSNTCPDLASSPCLKHAAENIARKASHMPSEKVSLCNNCSKSMLSYIFVVQDFLDSLAKEICGNSDPQDCVQCLRQKNRQSLSSYTDETSTAPAGEKESFKHLGKTTTDGYRAGSSKHEDSRSSKTPARNRSGPRDVRKYEESAETLIQRTLSEHHQNENKQSASTDYSHGSAQPPSYHGNNEGHSHGQGSEQSRNQEGDVHQRYDGRDQRNSEGGQVNDDAKPPGEGGQQAHQQYFAGSDEHVDNQSHQDVNAHCEGSTPPPSKPHISHDQSSTSHQGGAPQEHRASTPTVFVRPMERQQPDFTERTFHQDRQNGERSDRHEFPRLERSVSSPFSDGVDGIVSTLSNAEREVYDAARNGAGWDSLAEPQERLVSSSTNQIPSEAFVTMCRNNAEALGCLVVGTSLLLCRTTRTLCVLVSDGVSNAFRGPLASVFHVVQCVRALDSLGTTKLALLEQPELGISFEKLNIWRLVQFNKCVFLNPDTVVIQNCDELFGFDELSAVPDVGWPDCFNSGVFVFVPSIQTFWQLLEFAEKQGSYDGGDQGLLNSYYSNWSEDLTKKLSFIYNLMANVSYTYTPAFKQFGRNVKIVQFHGSFKPWHVKYFSRTGQISPASSVHPTYVQFVHVWINIFRISALRQLSREIQSYSQSQEVICAVELLRFFPLPTESEAEFFLTPPSVRLQLTERKLQRTAKIGENIMRRKSAEFSRISKDENQSEDAPVQQSQDTKATEVSSKAGVPSEAGAVGEAAENETTASEAVAIGEPKKAVIDKNILPGSEVGNYQGMKAWEQGRMDYQGTASSDNIMKRLEFLMTKPK